MRFCASGFRPRLVVRCHAPFVRYLACLARPVYCPSSRTGWTGWGRLAVAIRNRVLRCLIAGSALPSPLGVTARIFPAVLMTAVAAPCRRLRSRLAARRLAPRCWRRVTGRHCIYWGGCGVIISVVAGRCSWRSRTLRCGCPDRPVVERLCCSIGVKNPVDLPRRFD